MLDFFQFQAPTRIVGGSMGFLSQCGPELEGFRGSRAGVILDPIVKELGILESLLPSLQEASIEIAAVFSDVPADSDIAVVEAVAQQFQTDGCNLLIAIGGGSAMDTAKAINIVLTHGGNLRDYQGAQVLINPLLPLIAVPTTVGTGSEVTMVSVVVDRLEHRKITFVDRQLLPALAILDPAVTLTLPAKVIAATAMDALTHAVEAYVDLEHSPFSDAFAIAAGHSIRENLLAALRDRDDAEPRAQLQMASTMAGIAFNHSMVGIVHALAHSLGGVAGVPHGVANTLMLVEGLRCNLEVAADRIAEFGVLTGFASRGQTVEATASDVITAIDLFRASVCELSGLPQTLIEAGVLPEQLDALVERAAEDGSMVYNPKYVDVEEISSLYQKVMGGR